MKLKNARDDKIGVGTTERHGYIVNWSLNWKQWHHSVLIIWGWSFGRLRHKHLSPPGWLCHQECSPPDRSELGGAERTEQLRENSGHWLACKLYWGSQYWKKPFSESWEQNDSPIIWDPGTVMLAGWFYEERLKQQYIYLYSLARWQLRRQLG